ncbi:expressed unknown protein [Seminavis robusta]|uniref:Uncharacterized protein n=1 Tax=Seminavis robusta TaxID=568900 RepID=A0A9N8DT02_9STRA|nr:expressed unknown protein [Seminavis robusta]|eukprot:Sro334_g119820.1 n/a (312) ;mRNA; f:43268-44203
MWDKYALAETLKERNYARLFLVLPGHADRLHVGMNGLHAAREAGIKQVVVISVLTADTRTDVDGHFRPLKDDVKTLGRVSTVGREDNDAASLDESPPPLPLLAQAPMVRRISSTSVRNNVSSDHSSASGGSQDVSDPSKCLRIQRRNIVEGWFPMKVKIVQFSLPSFDPKSRAGKPVNATSDNGISLLEQALMGPYHSKVATASGIPTTPVDDSHVAGSSQLPDDGTLLNKAPTVWQEYLESLVPPGETVEVPKEISFTASPTPLAPAAVAPVHHLMLPTSTGFPLKLINVLYRTIDWWASSKHFKHDNVP